VEVQRLRGPEHNSVLEKVVDGCTIIKTKEKKEAELVNVHVHCIPFQLA
jgi:hypothetical protein